MKDITIVAKPQDNLALIMKDGKIYKNRIDGKVDMKMRGRIDRILGEKSKQLCPTANLLTFAKRGVHVRRMML